MHTNRRFLTKENFEKRTLTGDADSENCSYVANYAYDKTIVTHADIVLGWFWPDIDCNLISMLTPELKPPPLAM